MKEKLSNDNEIMEIVYMTKIMKAPESGTLLKKGMKRS